ncbi:TPA_asm: N [Corylus betacytorhabdovirus 1]|nr:TPA_asm: N [Corylus betacytorhabdovirus 1]
MAHEPRTLEDRIREAFALEGVPQTSVLVEKPFTNDGFVELDMYQFVNTKLSDSDLYSYGNHLVNQLKGNVANVHIGKLLLSLALNLRDPAKPGSSDLIFKKFYGSKPTLLQNNDLGFTRPAASSSEPPKAPTGGSGAGGTTTGGGNGERTDDAGQSKPSTESSMMSLVNSEHKLKNQSGETTTTLTCSPSFIPFLAAYLLKSQVKSPENLMLGEEKMRNSFMRFYKEANPLEIGLDKKSIETISERLKADQAIITTWIYVTATHETEAASTEPGSGVVRFLANLPFSFNGMHAYGLFREAVVQFEPNPVELMVKLWMSETDPVLAEIHRIMRTFETLTLKDGSTKKLPTYFKYARLVNPEYFARLQPARCLGLIYLLVKILKGCVEYSSVADPEKIMVLKKMGKARKEYFDAHIEALMEGAAEDDKDATIIAKRAAQIRAKKRETAPAVEEQMRSMLQGRG